MINLFVAIGAFFVETFLTGRYHVSTMIIAAMVSEICLASIDIFKALKESKKEASQK